MLAETLAKKVRTIQLQTNRLVSSGLAGAYLSVFKGRGIEFEEVRPYVPGDDVRDIDWNVTARTGEPHIKRYVEERELTVMLVVDISPSLDFGSADRSKRETAIEFAALVAFSAIHNGDKVGLILFDNETQVFIPPRKGNKHALLVVRELLAAGSAGGKSVRGLGARLRRAWQKLKQESVPNKTNIRAAMEFCREVLRRRAVVFVLSDFIDDDFLPAMQNAGRKHDIISVLVDDPAERQMARSGLVTLQDAETGDTVVVNAGSRKFSKALEHHAQRRIDEFEKSMRRSKLDVVRLTTDKPVVDPLLAFLHRRARRMRA